MIDLLPKLRSIRDLRQACDQSVIIFVRHIHAEAINAPLLQAFEVRIGRLG